MNPVRQFVRRTATNKSSWRSYKYGWGALQKTLSKPSSNLHTYVVEEMKRASPMVCTRLMSTATSKFEVVNIQDEEDFKTRVIEASSAVPIIVDFHATWCGPCKLLGPRLESILSEENGKVVMAKVDIDDNSDLAMEYGVRSVPTVLAVKDGKVKGQFVGLIDDDKIRTFVEKLIIS